ncbi:MAG TPA: NnrS family protein [Petrimonas sp.]|uniref:NnrS family protein n=1 Tax=Petrimonas sp. TaxID=2023866 RepID=UPI00175C3413|nr:NnrS family protein [Petrimonas sp.]
MYNNQLSGHVKVPLANRIYRFFFISALVIIFTLGCMWGAINLLLIGLEGSFHGIDYSWVLAHGHAMVFGFVGLFIMGFSFQAIPRYTGITLWRPRLALSALPLMITGILLQALAHVIAPRPPYLLLGVAAGGLQLVAVAIFVLVVVRTLHGTHVRRNNDGFIYAALGWFLLAAIINPIIFSLFESAGTEEEFLFNVSSFNIPYRDIQTLGIAVVMILGMSLHILPHAYGFREPSSRWRKFLLWGVNGAILFGVISFTAGMTTGVHWWHAANGISYIILLVAAIGTPIQFRLFRRVPEGSDRSLKFIRAAYLWFIVAMLLLAFGPYYMFGIYLPMTGGENPFSHAYFGAYRHALTVGFIMMMIVGVSSKVVPIFSGIDIRKTNSLWAVFILLNLGNAWRIISQITTDFFPQAFGVIGISGFIELTALGLWGYELIKNIQAGKRMHTYQP